MASPSSVLNFPYASHGEALHKILLEFNIPNSSRQQSGRYNLKKITDVLANVTEILIFRIMNDFISCRRSNVYLNYKNDHQRKDVNIETNSFNHKQRYEQRYNGVFVRQMMIMEAFLFQMQISNQLHLKGKDDIKLYPTGLCRPIRSSSLSHWLNPRSSSNNYIREHEDDDSNENVTKQKI